ncbi:MAG TPA: IS110 family transposase [Terriglobales bacterium]|nr:IS110 family transposase [Terriglobales bacterium]
MKKHNNSGKKSEPTSKPTKSRGPVQRDTKEVLAELVGKLKEKLDRKKVAATSAGEKLQSGELRPNLDRLTVGVDLGDQWSHYCILGLEGETLAEGQLRTTQQHITEFFQALNAARVVFEVGTHSPWVQEVICGCGHEVLVANPRLMEGSKRRKRKNDRIDANKLARLGRVDPQSLHPMQHRSREVRQDLVVLRARDALVAARTELINATRGLVKSMGSRLPKCSSPSFAQKAEETVPVEIREALLPLVRMAATLSDCIQGYDEKIEKLGREKYGHTALLRQVKGVGPITALAYVLTLENPDRFVKSRDVGPYLGLVPKQEDSGESQPQLGISKAGDTMMRRLLVGSAHYILGPFGPDTDLRRYGLRLCERGGKNAKKRAAVAVARKLAVLLHCLWVSGEVYEPLRQGMSATIAPAVAA